MWINRGGRSMGIVDAPRTDAFAKSAESKSGGAADVKSICRGSGFIPSVLRFVPREKWEGQRAGSARVESDYAGPDGYCEK
jgi:hypothetical protein